MLDTPGGSEDDTNILTWKQNFSLIGNILFSLKKSDILRMLWAKLGPSKSKVLIFRLCKKYHVYLNMIVYHLTKAHSWQKK